MNRDLSPADRQLVLSAIAHRGPDDHGDTTLDQVWLANTRLAIRDLSQKGHQPMQTADGRYTLVFNGELYNHPELRRELAANGHAFYSESDTETLLHCFAAWGTGCLTRLNGIFAFAVYDRLEQELLIARDAVGVKPLYYYRKDDQLLFASELKALTGISGLDKSICPQAFHNHLTLLYQPGTGTPFRYFQKLLPGHFIRVRNGVAAPPEAWYKIPFQGAYDALSGQEWENLLDDHLQRAVRSQLLSDAPVGFFLSGGLDSSLVTAIARSQDRDRQLSCFTIDTSGSMAAEGFGDDLPFAKKVAAHLDATLHIVPGSIDMANMLDRMVWQMDEPNADPAALHVLHIAAAARQEGIKVLLGGTGADDLFSGYRRHQALYYESLIRKVPGSWSQTAVRMLRGLKQDQLARRIGKLSRAAGSTLTDGRIAAHYWMEPDAAGQLFLPDVAAAIPDPGLYFRSLLEEIPAEQHPLNQLLYWELRSFLPDHNLNYTDKMSMAAGVEARVPYLDTDLIGLACRMPPQLKMKGTQTKYLLRRVARKYLPEEIIYRKKTGFGAPLRQWIKGGMHGLVKERLLSGSLERWDIFRPAAIEQLIRDNDRGRTDGAYPIFALLCIESWLRQFAAN